MVLVFARSSSKKAIIKYIAQSDNQSIKLSILKY